VKQALICHLYLIFVFCFMTAHRFSKFSDDFESNVYNYMENNLFNGPFLKNVLCRPSSDRDRNGFTIDHICNSRDWIIYQNFIINNLSLSN
jgi:hypothetical protein